MGLVQSLASCASAAQDKLKVSPQMIHIGNCRIVPPESTMTGDVTLRKFSVIAWSLNRSVPGDRFHCFS